MSGNPPALVPEDIEDPIIIEAIKAEEGDEMPVVYPEGKKLGYAVVGLGHLSLEELLPALQQCKKSRIAALVSGHPEKLKRTGLMYGVPASSQYSYENFDQIAENEEVDAVFIVLPNSMHLEYTVRSAKAKKHVLCEKPMAMNSDECREMIRVCRDHKVKLMIAYRVQYEPYNNYVKEQLSRGAIGNVKFVTAQNGQKSGNPDHWRYKMKLSGGGALPDIGIYCINTTRFILGKEPVEVSAFQYSNPKDPCFKEVEEMVCWQMKFPNGIIAQCTTSYQAHTVKDYRVVGDQGWLHLKNAYAYKGHQLLHAKNEENNPVAEIDIDHVNQFAEEMDYFADCIINDQKPLTDGEEGLRDHLIMEAIFESARKNKPVTIRTEINS